MRESLPGAKIFKKLRIHPGKYKGRELQYQEKVLSQYQKGASQDQGSQWDSWQG